MVHYQIGFYAVKFSDFICQDNNLYKPKKKIQRMKHLWIIIILIFLVGCRTAGQTQDQGTPPRVHWSCERAV